MAAANWVNIVYGIWDRQIHRVTVRDGDSEERLTSGEQLVRMPVGKYNQLTLDQLALELML